jgi:hypothetical protein
MQRKQHDIKQCKEVNLKKHDLMVYFRSIILKGL